MIHSLFILHDPSLSASLFLCCFCSVLCVNFLSYFLNALNRTLYIYLFLLWSFLRFFSSGCFWLSSPLISFPSRRRYYSYHIKRADIQPTPSPPELIGGSASFSRFLYFILDKTRTTHPIRSLHLVSSSNSKISAQMNESTTEKGGKKAQKNKSENKTKTRNEIACKWRTGAFPIEFCFWIIRASARHCFFFVACSSISSTPSSVVCRRSGIFSLSSSFFFLFSETPFFLSSKIPSTLWGSQVHLTLEGGIKRKR